MKKFLRLWPEFEVVYYQTNKMGYVIQTKNETKEELTNALKRGNEVLS